MDSNLQKLSQGTGRDLHNLQVKLTYVGPQLKRTASVAFTTFYHLLQMSWFLPLRRPELSYGNDEGEVWNFTVAPREMERVLARMIEFDAGDADAPHLSLMMVLRESRLGETAYEAVFDEPQARAMNRAIYDSLDENNSVGRTVLDLQHDNI